MGQRAFQLGCLLPPLAFEVLNEGGHCRVLVKFVKSGLFKPPFKLLEVINIQQKDGFRWKQFGCFG